jgi:GNAT superfamily N-acetyltransferase
LLFEQYIFPDYTEEGKEAVRRYITVPSLIADDSENFTLVARLHGSLVGIAKVKSRNHLSMLFVLGPCQGRGYGRRLLEAAITECKARHPDLANVSANSSRFALPFFREHGFRVVDEERQVTGIRFTPVRLDLVNASPPS